VGRLHQPTSHAWAHLHHFKTVAKAYPNCGMGYAILRVHFHVHSGPMSGTPGLDPMWLLLFPEGTNFTRNTAKISARFSEKANIPNVENALLPRGTGLYFCLKELEGTVDYIYDCTIAYEGVK
jgi:hypothetical protein